MLSHAATSTNKQFIKNFLVPTCKNCLYFIPATPDIFKREKTQCLLFGEKNIVSGEITFDYTQTCREDGNKCGIQGRYFKEK